MRSFLNSIFGLLSILCLIILKFLFFPILIHFVQKIVFIYYSIFIIFIICTIVPQTKLSLNSIWAIPYWILFIFNYKWRSKAIYTKEKKRNFLFYYYWTIGGTNFNLQVINGSTLEKNYLTVDIICERAIYFSQLW